MKKQIILPFKNLNHWLILMLFTSVVLINSCKKDTNQNPQSLGQQELKALAEWYKKKLVVADTNQFSRMKPNWRNVYVNELADIKVYEVALQNPENFIVSTSSVSKDNFDQQNSKHTIRLLIFEDSKTEELKYFSYIVIENSGITDIESFHYKKPGQFSGKILFYSPRGNFTNGWTYGEGRINQRITTAPKGNYAKAGGLKDIKLSTTYGSGNNCVNGSAERYMIVCGSYEGSTETSCRLQFIGFTPVTYCTEIRNEGDEGSGGTEGPGGGGYFPPINMDCANVENGTAYFNESCKTCMGGTTGILACPVDTAMNPKFVKNTKAMCALKKLMENNFYKNILNNFIGSNKPIDLTFKIDSIPQTPGFQTDANTIPNPATWNSNNIDITLAENIIDSLTSLEVATALLHEGIHAEIFRKLISIHGPGYLSNSNFPTLFNLYNQYKVNQGYAHEYMANYYVSLMSSALRKYDNNKFTIDYYEAIAWSGLRGTKAFTDLSTNKKSEINDKLATLLNKRSKTNCDDL